MDQSQLLYLNIAFTLVALLMLALSLFWKSGGRLLLSLVFLIAGIYDFRTGMARSQDYVPFVRISYFSPLLGFFLHHTTGVIVAIAIGQLAIGVLLLLRGWPVEVGLWGALLFLMGLAPLATVVSFWPRMIMACAAIVLLRAQYNFTVWSELGESLHHHHPTARPAAHAA